MLNKIKKLFCRHRTTEQMVKVSPFQNLRGERVYTVCKNCGKIIESTFYEHEGMGWK